MIALVVLTFSTIAGDLVAVSTAENLFAAAFLVTDSDLGNLNQFAIIREAHGIVAELSKVTNLGPIGSSIAKSGHYLSMTMTLLVLFSVRLIGSFALLAM